jgi:hypothetical protein
MNAKIIGASLLGLLASFFVAATVAQAQVGTPTPTPTTTTTTEQTVGSGATPDAAPATGLGGS